MSIKTRDVNWIYQHLGIMVLIFIPFFQPEIVSNSGVLSYLYILFRIAISLFVFIALLLRKNISYIIIYIILYQLFSLIITFANNPSFAPTVLLRDTYIIALLALIDVGLRSNAEKVLRALKYLMGTLIIINFITIIMFPHGVYIDHSNREAFFLGIGNAMTSHILFAMTIAIISSLYSKNKIDLYAKFIILISLVTVLINSSATGLVTVTIYIILVLFGSVFKKFNLSFTKVVLSSLIIQFIILNLNKFTNIFLVKYLFEEILDKTLTLTGRIPIWEKAIHMFYASPIWGYGATPGGNMIEIYGSAFSAHNLFLQTLLEVGLIGTIIFLLILFLSGLNLQQYKESKLSRYLNIGIFTFFLLFFAEISSTKYIYIILIISANIGKLINSIEYRRVSLTD